MNIIHRNIEDGMIDNTNIHEGTPLLLQEVQDETVTTDKKDSMLLSVTPSTSSTSASTTDSINTSIKTSVWGYYMMSIDRHPIITKCVTATIILSFADIVAQLVKYYISTTDTPAILHSHHLTIDILRTMRFGILGLVGAPWSHYYFYYLDYYLPPSLHTDKYYPFTLRTIIKVLIDQCIQAPLLLAIMIAVLGCLKGGIMNRCSQHAQQDLSDTYKTSLIANWKLWIPASIINIAFVPPTLRVLYVNIIFFFWTIILSLLIN